MKKTYLTIIAGLAIAAAAVVAIGQEQPNQQINDSWFTPDSDSLRQVPANLIVVRPTHFPEKFGRIRHYHENETLARTVGRNATLRETMAEAYDCGPMQVVLPPDAPKGGFDFLVTTPGHVRAQLRSAISENLGYTAHSETQNVDAWVLTVIDPALPGMTPSSDDEESDIDYHDGRLYFKHQQLSRILDGLSEGLNRPVLDETGLTNYYDFSVTWNDDIANEMRNGTFHLDGTRKVLAGWGLGLEATNTPMEMFIVEKTQ